MRRYTRALRVLIYINSNEGKELRRAFRNVRKTLPGSLYKQTRLLFFFKELFPSPQNSSQVYMICGLGNSSDYFLSFKERQFFLSKFLKFFLDIFNVFALFFFSILIFGLVAWQLFKEKAYVRPIFLASQINF